MMPFFSGCPHMRARGCDSGPSREAPCVGRFLQVEGSKKSGALEYFDLLGLVKGIERVFPKRGGKIRQNRSWQRTMGEEGEVDSYLWRGLPGLLLGVVGTADEGARFDVYKAQGHALLLQYRKLFWVVERATGKCCLVGWRYWPMVMMSQPTERRSRMTSRASSMVSPIPRISPDLVRMPRCFALPSNSIER